MRRLERAVLLGESDADADPVRLQSVSFYVGALLAVLGVAGCALFGWIKPAAGLGDDSILMDRASGALYVRVGATVHPVMNLTSARLITGVDDAPRQVAAADLAGVERGPLLGIPGAPAAIGPALSAQESGWTVCDSPATTVIAGPLSSEGKTRALPVDESVLVSSRSGSTYLLYNGSRALIDMTDAVTVRALHLDGRTPRPASQALLNVIPELPPIAAPVIPDRGSHGPLALPGFAVGDVFRVEQASATEYFVVLAGGVQRIGAVAADLIQFAAARPGADITAVAPSAVSDMPTLGILPIAEFPDRVGALLADDVPVLCASWLAGKAALYAGSGLPLRETQVPIPLAQGDGAGAAVDAVFLPPGRSAYIGSTGAAGVTGSLVADTGVRYPVADTDAARVLGLPDHPEPAPWPLVTMLPSGPELRRDAALLARDVQPSGPPGAGG